MDRLTRQIGTFATDLTFDNLGKDIANLGAQHLIDTLGCAIGAHDCQAAEIGRRLASNQSPGVFPGRILFKNSVLPLEMAGFINACMIRNFDFNDRYPGGHPSDGLGAHLALAGAMPINGKRFLAAVLVTYEVFIRLSEFSKMSHLGWDQGFAVGLSAAAGVCTIDGVPTNDNRADMCRARLIEVTPDKEVVFDMWIDGSNEVPPMPLSSFRAEHVPI